MPWNQKNNNCDMVKLDFKIFEFELLKISLKILSPIISIFTHSCSKLIFYGRVSWYK